MFGLTGPHSRMLGGLSKLTMCPSEAPLESHDKPLRPIHKSPEHPSSLPAPQALWFNLSAGELRSGLVKKGYVWRWKGLSVLIHIHSWHPLLLMFEWCLRQQYVVVNCRASVVTQSPTLDLLGRFPGYCSGSDEPWFHVS